MALPRDGLWPRAGDRPAPASYQGDIDLALIMLELIAGLGTRE
ncbi:hypothetical protein [Microbacterium sp.]|nr:hypothetical protein [Microbacterium sp.]